MRMNGLRYIVVWVMSVVLFSTSAAADYKEQLAGRQLDVMVGFSNSGGGARFWDLFSTHLRQHLPDTIIRAEFNDGPLAVKAVGELYDAEDDTLTIGLIRPPELAFFQIDNPDEVTYELRDAHWLLSVENLSYIMTARKGLATDPVSLRSGAGELILPVGDALSTASRISVLLSAVTDIPARNVVGFNRSARKKAILAGDVDLLSIGLDPALVSVIKSGDLEVLYKIVGDDFSALEEDTSDLSAFLRADAPETVVNFIQSARGMGRAFFTPPGTSPADVAALREVLEAVVADPDFIADAELKGIPINEKSGDNLTNQVFALIPGSDTEREAILNAYNCGLEMVLAPEHECAF